MKSHQNDLSGSEEVELSRVELLSEQGNNTNVTDRYGNTNLHDACVNGYRSVVKYLLAASANPDASNGEGDTPLLLAITVGNFDIVVDLVVAGANINTRTKDQFTPLLMAIMSDNLQIAKFLMQKGAVIERLNNQGEFEALDRVTTIGVYLAAKTGILEDDGYCTNIESVIHKLTEDGNTLLNIAITQKEFEFAEESVRLTSINDINQVNNQGNTPLHIAADIGNLKIIESLIDKGASFEQLNNDGHTPLHIAAKRANIQALQYLLDIGANINARDDEGNTPLHLAARAGYQDCVEILVGYGADINSTNRHGDAPIDFTVRQEHFTVLKYLIQNGTNIWLKLKPEEVIHQGIKQLLFSAQIADSIYAVPNQEIFVIKDIDEDLFIARLKFNLLNYGLNMKSAKFLKYMAQILPGELLQKVYNLVHELNEQVAHFVGDLMSRIAEISPAPLSIILRENSDGKYWTEHNRELVKKTIEFYASKEPAFSDLGKRLCAIINKEIERAAVLGNNTSMIFTKSHDKDREISTQEIADFIETTTENAGWYLNNISHSEWVYHMLRSQEIKRLVEQKTTTGQKMYMALPKKINAVFTEALEEYNVTVSGPVMEAVLTFFRETQIIQEELKNENARYKLENAELKKLATQSQRVQEQHDQLFQTLVEHGLQLSKLHEIVQKLEANLISSDTSNQNTSHDLRPQINDDDLVSSVITGNTSSSDSDNGSYG
jgi:uncharacterized protein